MTPEELLKPRYKVISDYPGTHTSIGDILYSSDLESVYNKYPSIFRKMEWWEDRKAEEMPEYVKYHFSGEVYKLVDLDWEAILHPVDFKPTTEEEYITSNTPAPVTT